MTGNNSLLKNTHPIYIFAKYTQLLYLYCLLLSKILKYVL